MNSFLNITQRNNNVNLMENLEILAISLYSIQPIIFLWLTSKNKNLFFSKILQYGERIFFSFTEI